MGCPVCSICFIIKAYGKLWNCWQYQSIMITGAIVIKSMWFNHYCVDVALAAIWNQLRSILDLKSCSHYVAEIELSCLWLQLWTGAEICFRPAFSVLSDLFWMVISWFHLVFIRIEERVWKPLLKYFFPHTHSLLGVFLPTLYTTLLCFVLLGKNPSPTSTRGRAKVKI